MDDATVTEAGQVVVEGSPPAVWREVHALHAEREAVGCIAMRSCLNGTAWHEGAPAEEAKAGGHQQGHPSLWPPVGGPILAEELTTRSPGKRPSQMPVLVSSQ